MKYIILLSIICINILNAKPEEIDSNATPKYYYMGLSAGPTFSNLRTNIDNIDIEMGTSYSLGYHLYQYLDKSKKHSLVSKVNISSRKVIFTVPDILDLTLPKKEYSEINRSFDISMAYKRQLLKFNKNSFYGIGGLYYSYLIETLGEDNNTYITNKDYKKHDFGIFAGLGYEIEFDSFLLGLEYSYMHGFINKLDNDNSYLKNQTHLINFVFTMKHSFQKK